MVTVSKDLITDKLMSKEKIRNKVIENLKKGKFSVPMAFGVFLPRHSGDLYEIIALNELRKPPYQGEHFYMVGMAGSKSEAIMLVARLWLRSEGRRQ